MQFVWRGSKVEVDVENELWPQTATKRVMSVGVKTPFMIGVVIPISVILVNLVF
jgi:hypothetical protein